MAILDVIKWNAPQDLVLWKFPRDAITTASQVIVNESQEAIFFVDGKRADTLGPGRHALQTANLPILRSLVGLAFGGESPFAAEIWFVQKTVAMNIPWGTTSPMLLEDPQYGFVVPVGSHGQFGIEVIDSALFLGRMAGTMPAFGRKALSEHFRAILLSHLKSSIARLLVEDKVPILQMETQLPDFSSRIEAAMQPEFATFGLRITGFRIMGIHVPENDPSVVALKQAKATMARRQIEGVTTTQDRQFELMRTLAANEGPNAMMLLNAQAAYPQMGHMMGGYLTGSLYGAGPGWPASPPVPPAVPSPTSATPAVWFAHLNGANTGPHALGGLQSAVASGALTPSTLMWRPGMPSWIPATQIPELAVLFAPPVPPPVPPVPPTTKT